MKIWRKTSEKYLNDNFFQCIDVIFFWRIYQIMPVEMLFSIYAIMFINGIIASLFSA
jgi:hypothetical protein